MKEEKEGEASRLIISLISSSYAVRSFPAKWHSMRDKLEKLNSGLSAAGTDTGRISGLGELLQAVAATVSEGQSLADRCGDEHRRDGGGKLQLRSDLDVVISRLGLHMERLDEIYASGSVTHSRAIVLSKPGVGAGRDDMRVYVKDIFTRLRIGGTELRRRALASLNEVLSEDDEKYVSIVAGETVDGISLLVRLLESGDIGIQEAASEAIAAIAGFECYIGVLAPAGAIGPLIRVLETGSEPAKGRAGVALRRMTANSDNSWSVSAQGGVASLLKICDDDDDDGGTSSKELIASVLAVLKDISSVSEIKRFMVERGAISVVTKLLGSKEEAKRIQAMDFLAALAFDDESVKERVVREGAVERLVGVLQPSSQHSPKAKEVALRAIETFCFASASSVRVLIGGSGFLDRLLFLLRHGEVSVKESAVKSVSRLCSVSEEANKAMGDIGFMTELVNLLEVRSFEAREAAAEALCSLISVQRNRRRFVQDERNVNRILRLLDPEEEKQVAVKKLLLSALLALTDSRSARRRIAASDYAKNLEKLADDDFGDAKKIVKKLSGNRFWNILYRIWSS